MATFMAFDGESFTNQEIEDNMDKLPTNLRWLLTDQYKVDKVHIAALVKQGYDNENRWRHLGNSREEFFESSKDVMNLQPTTREMRKLRLQLVCVWSDCKDSAVESQRRESVATSLGISLPVDAGATRLLIDRVQAMSPGRTFKREERPTGGYLGFLEGILKSKDYRAEPLAKVVLEGDSKSKHSGSTTLDGTTITLELTAPIPKHAAHFKIKIKGMGMAWVAQSIKHQQLDFLKDLRVETYEAYGEYVCSDKVAMMQRDDGQYPAWDNVMEADLATRNDWWEDVIVRKLSLNYAILKSIGENETKTPSGNWQQMVVNKLALGGGKGPGKGKAAPAWPIKGASAQASAASYVNPAGQVVNPPGTGKRQTKRAAAAMGGGNANAWQAAPPPKIPKGAHKGAWQAPPPPMPHRPQRARRERRGRAREAKRQPPQARARASRRSSRASPCGARTGRGSATTTTSRRASSHRPAPTATTAAQSRAAPSRAVAAATASGPIEQTERPPLSMGRPRVPPRAWGEMKPL